MQPLSPQGLPDRPPLHGAAGAGARAGGRQGAARLSAPVVADYRELGPLVQRERSAGRRVALANGCFDVLHVGHVRLLADARRHCDVLVVALNSDESTRESKGPSRPLVPLAERMELVAALAGVDYVTSFGERTADAIIRALRPDLLVKGTDRSPDDVPERDTLAACGGRVLICGDAKAHSSSELIRRLGEEPPPAGAPASAPGRARAD